MLQVTTVARRFGIALGLFIAGGMSVRAGAAPVLINMTLHATSGSQFGVTAPADILGSFNVDSSFLAQANGNYSASGVTNFQVVVGTEHFQQSTAFAPNLNGLILTNHQITNIQMNFQQDPNGILGPYMQSSSDGSWETGSSALQDGAVILRGTAGNQSFGTVPEPCTAMLAATGLLFLRRRQTGAGGVCVRS